MSLWGPLDWVTSGHVRCLNWISEYKQMTTQTNKFFTASQVPVWIVFIYVFFFNSIAFCALVSFEKGLNEGLSICLLNDLAGYWEGYGKDGRVGGGANLCRHQRERNTSTTNHRPADLLIMWGKTESRAWLSHAYTDWLNNQRIYRSKTAFHTMTSGNPSHNFNSIRHNINALRHAHTHVED